MTPLLVSFCFSVRLFVSVHTWDDTKVIMSVDPSSATYSVCVHAAEVRLRIIYPPPLFPHGSLMWKCCKFQFSLIYLHSIRTMTRQQCFGRSIETSKSIFAAEFYRRLQMWGDLHTWIWGFSAILSLRSSRALSGWIESRRRAIFILSLKQMDVWVQVRSLTVDPIIVALKLLLCCVVAPLEAELLEKYQVVLMIQRQVFIKDKSVLASFKLSFTFVWACQWKRKTLTARCRLMLKIKFSFRKDTLSFLLLSGR